MRGSLIFIVVALLCITKVNGQITFDSRESYTAPFSTYEEIMGGAVKSNYLNVGLHASNGLNYPAGWTIQVRANGEFTNGINTIPLQYISLTLNSSGGIQGLSGKKVTLNTTNSTLISSTATFTTPLIYFAALTFDMTIQGGAHLMVPSTGKYSTTLTISFRDQDGNLVASKNDVPLSLTINYSNTCMGTQIGDINTAYYNFDTYAKLQSGATITDALTIPFGNSSGINCRGWSLKVSASGNFVNGSSTVGAPYVALRFNRVAQGSATSAEIGASTTPVDLGMSEVALINQSNASLGSYSALKFDMIIQGGNVLSSATTQGTYTCPLVFTLYNQNGQIVSTKNVSVSFQINYANSTGFTLTIQNPNVLLQYNSIAKYLNGVSVNQENGLKVLGYSAYQVIVKTLGSNLVNGENTLPVSLIKLQNTSSTGTLGITSTNINLSAIDQVIITNNMADYTYQTTNYNLEYIMEPNDSITTAPSGTYTTQVIYVVLPK